MPGTPAQEAARLKAVQANRDNAAKRRAEKETGRPAPAVTSPPAAATDDQGEVIQFDAAKILRYALNAPHDALAVMTGHDEMRLSKTEEAVASSTVMTSLELVGWTRFIIYLAPIAAIMVLVAIEGGRIRVLREMWAQKRAEAEIAAATARGSTFTQQFEDEVKPAREARQAQASSRPAVAPGAARGVDPMDLTYLEETG